MSQDQNTYRALRAFKAAQVAAAFKARAAEVEPPCEGCSDEVPVTAAAAKDVPFYGYATLYDVRDGGGRLIEGGSLTWDLDTEGVPILWDRDDGDHSGMVLGRLDTIVNDSTGPFVTGRLFGTDDPAAAAAVARVAELIAENAIGWSIMLDDESITLTIRDPDITQQPDGATVVKIDPSMELLNVTSGRLRHLAIVDTPAFPGARPVLGQPPVAAAAGVGFVFPASHFEKWPESREAVPLQTTPDGRFWGHAAGDGCYRDGNTTRCEKYSRDADPEMRNFHTSTATLDTGEVIRVGVLTAGSLHAPVTTDIGGQRAYHENSSTIYAKVRAWEDSRGRLCISGSMIPGLDPSFAAQVAGLGLSVEKWPAHGVRGLTLAGAHAVPAQAWPVLA